MQSVKYSLLYALEFPNRIENTNIANAILSDPNATKEFSKRAEVAAPFIPKDLGRNYTNKTIDERKQILNQQANKKIINHLKKRQKIFSINEGEQYALLKTRLINMVVLPLLKKNKRKKQRIV